MAAARYVVVHRDGITVAKRPAPTDPSGPPPVVKTDPAITVGVLDQSNEPCTVPIGIAAYDPATSNTVTEIHAIQFPGAATIEDGQAALDEARAKGYPIGSADASSVNGQTITLDIPGMIETVEGTQDTFLVIAGFDR